MAAGCHRRRRLRKERADPWERTGYSFDEVLPAAEGWAKENRHYWRQDWRGYVEFFMSRITTEPPHSTKPYDDLADTRPGYRKVPRGGADRAAARIGTLLAG